MGKLTAVQICDELLHYVKTNMLENSVNILPETPFKEVGLDSMSIIELVLFIERKFGVAIGEHDLLPENLKSIKLLADCTYKYL